MPRSRSGSSSMTRILTTRGLTEPRNVVSIAKRTLRLDEEIIRAKSKPLNVGLRWLELRLAHEYRKQHFAKYICRMELNMPARSRRLLRRRAERRRHHRSADHHLADFLLGTLRPDLHHRHGPDQRRVPDHVDQFEHGDGAIAAHLLRNSGGGLLEQLGLRPHAGPGRVHDGPMVQ